LELGRTGVVGFGRQIERRR